MLRVAALITNACCLLFFMFTLIERGIERGLPSKGEDWLIIFLFTAAPTLSLICLALFPTREGSDLFSLYLERKRLEQQQRIAELKKQLP